MIRRFAIAVACASLVLATGCEQSNGNSGPVGSASSKAASATASAASSTSATATATAKSDASVAAAATGSTVPVPANGRMEPKVNATFHYYPAGAVDTLAAEQKKLLSNGGFAIDDSKVVGGYHVMNVSKGSQKAKVSVGCTQKECFVSVQDNN